MYKQTDSRHQTSECICGKSVLRSREQYFKTIGVTYNKGISSELEQELGNLESSIISMGESCKIDVSEPLKHVQIFRGHMDSFGHREKPEEGLNYFEIDIDNYFTPIYDGINNSLDRCEKAKQPIKRIKN